MERSKLGQDPKTISLDEDQPGSWRARWFRLCIEIHAQGYRIYPRRRSVWHGNQDNQGITFGAIPIRLYGYGFRRASSRPKPDVIESQNCRYEVYRVQYAFISNFLDKLLDLFPVKDRGVLLSLSYSILHSQLSLSMSNLCFFYQFSLQISTNFKHKSQSYFTLFLKN